VAQFGGHANALKEAKEAGRADGVTNTLIGCSGMDWYFASLPPDTIKKMFGQDVLTPTPRGRRGGSDGLARRPDLHV
jgi:hypothetical protein